MNIKITQIEITLPSRTIKLKLEEAEELYKELGKLFGTGPNYVVHYVPTVVPYTEPPGSPWTPYPQITWTASSDPAVNTKPLYYSEASPLIRYVGEETT